MDHPVVTLGEILDRRLSIALPLTIITGISQKLVTGGTYFLASYQHRIFALTAHHCISNANIEMSESQILLGERSILPVICCTFPKANWDEYGRPKLDDSRDIAIFELDGTELNRPEDTPTLIPQSLDGVTFPGFPIGTSLFVEGYPRKRSQPNRRESRIERTSNKVAGVFEGQEEPNCGRVKFVRYSDRDLNGFSGSPVFAWHRLTPSEGRIGFVGMMIETRRFLFAHVIVDELRRHIVETTDSARVMPE